MGKYLLKIFLYRVEILWRFLHNTFDSCHKYFLSILGDEMIIQKLMILASLIGIKFIIKSYIQNLSLLFIIKK